MKRFYNNTLIGRAFSKALRVVALLCVLLGFSSSAWGDTYFLWYNAKSNEPNYKNSNFTMSAGAPLTNNKCVWTISNLRKDNSYFYISTSSTYSESNLLGVEIVAHNPQDGTVNGAGKQPYDNKVGFYVSCQKAGSTVTITIDFSSNSQYVVSPVGGGAAACTPSATITGASYDGTNINLSGRLSKVCDSKTTYYGWQYKTSANGNWEDAITGAANNSSNVAKDYSKSWNNGGNLVAGTTYYFRAYATYDAKTWYSDDKILSVTIPKGGGSTGEADCSGVVYLDPNIYVGDDAWFAAYFFGNEDIWVEMTPACDGLYKAMIPDGATGVTFVRKNPADKTLESWNNKWNQTVDLQIQTNKYFKVENWNAKDGKETGTWYDTDCTDGCIPAEQPSTNVLLSREAIVNKSAKTAQLFGYLKSIKAPDCPESEIADYGFFYCMVNDGDTPCLPTSTSSSTKIAADPSPALSRGMEFTATVGLIKEPSDALQDGKTYYYRAYAKIDDQYILSGEIRSFSTDPCIPQYGGLSKKYVAGTPIVYTINADPAFVANDCKLHFNSLQDAINHLKATYTKDDDFKYVTLSNDGSYNLNQPVEMRVMFYDDKPDDEAEAFAYRGTTDYGMSAGDVKPANINLIKDINKTLADKDAKNTLTITTASKAKPWIHHPVIRNSRYIILDGLYITSDRNETKKDNAIEIDIDNETWPNVSALETDAHVVIQNCVIDSKGFTGIHISGYNGITLKGNDIEASFTDRTNETNILNWGASAKFLACKNIKFIQNNFRGSQPTLLWIQDSENALFMNNVFWNTNTYTTTGGVTPSAIRLVNQYGKTIQNISFFYNTFYFEENGTTGNTSKYNFFIKYSAASDGSTTGSQYFGSNIYFQYNNCYSYDKDCPGSDAFYATGSGDGTSVNYVVNSEKTDDANFCPNNFWSVYDYENNKQKSVFDFTTCNGSQHINVRNQVCSTSAKHPASLIVKGDGMDMGSKPDISSTGISLTDNESTSDRYLIGVRPIDKNDKTWTYGAYQSKDAVDTEVIYWVGFSDVWDDRGNWEYVDHNTGERLPVSCINNFSENLKVVIEETADVVGTRKWPKVPESFTTNRSNMEYGEHVSAGLGVINNPTKFASTIELEYGAGLRGVENLNDNGTMRYDQAIVHFDAERNKWLLVGPIIRPFDTEKNDGTTRNVNSGDYFRNFEPQIYMHGTVVDGNTISWGKTFGDLNVNVTPDTVFAINASVLYGKYYDTAEDYLKYEGIKVDDKAPIPYRFTGRFAVEEYKTGDAYQYTLKKTNDKNLINNVYPCNLDAKAIESEGYGTVNIYDYEKASFVSTTATEASGNVYIKAQNGFVFTPNAGQQLILTNDILAEGSTRTRAGEIPLPTFSLNVDNANTTKPGASNIVVRYDEFLGTSEESLLNTPKVFTRNSDTPEAYIIHNDGKYTRLDAGKEKVTIPSIGCTFNETNELNI